MATSLQRIIAILIIIDFVYVIGIGIYHQTSGSEDEMQTYLGRYQNFSDEYVDKYAEFNPDTETIYLEKQFGDQKAGGEGWYTIFTKGLPDVSADSCNSENCSRANYWIIGGINIVMVIIHILAIFEIFQILYTKKNS